MVVTKHTSINRVFKKMDQSLLKRHNKSLSPAPLNSDTKSKPTISALSLSLQALTLAALSLPGLMPMSAQDATIEDTQAFLGKYPANFTVMTDVDEHCAKNFAIKAMPSSFLIDRKGVIRSTHLGFRDDDAKAIRALIEQLLEETPTPQ